MPRRDRIVAALELKVPPVALVLLFAAAMWLVSTSESSLALHIPWRTAVALVFAIAGIAISVAGVAAFRRAGTTVDPTRPGKASAMVVSGVYRWSRNPMYAGFLLALAGWAAFLSHALAFAFLPAFILYINRFQIIPEERMLAEKFGEQFTAYRGTVRRWL